MNIAYRITAVPERLENAKTQAKCIGFDDGIIYLDKDHNGNIGINSGYIKTSLQMEVIPMYV